MNRPMLGVPEERKPASGYPHEQPLPGGPKMPGRGRPDESQNDPDRKPGQSPEEE